MAAWLKDISVYDIANLAPVTSLLAIDLLFTNMVVKTVPAARLNAGIYFMAKQEANILVNCVPFDVLKSGTNSSETHEENIV